MDKMDKPGEIPLQPDPGSPQPEEPTNPVWPSIDPEIDPGIEPQPGTAPVEIPSEPEQ